MKLFLDASNINWQISLLRTFVWWWAQQRFIEDVFVIEKNKWYWEINRLKIKQINLPVILETKTSTQIEVGESKYGTFSKYKWDISNSVVSPPWPLNATKNYKVYDDVYILRCSVLVLFVLNMYTYLMYNCSEYQSNSLVWKRK